MNALLGHASLGRALPGESRARNACLCLAILLLSPAPPAQAAVGRALQAQGWQEIANPNKAENAYSATPQGAIEVVSDNSVSTLYRPVDVNLEERPLLTWRWRVENPAPATDLSAEGRDDCSLAIYVGFPYDPDDVLFLERLKRPLVESWAGENAPGRVLRYVFCGRHRQGEVVESPYLGSAGFMRVLRPASSPTGKWFEEQVNIAADYREAFGEAPPDPSQIAIQADTDDTQSASRAYVDDLAFAPLPG